MNEQMAVRTRFFDDFFTSAHRRRHPPGGDPGLRASTPGPIGCHGPRAPRSSRSTSRRSSTSRPAPWPSSGPSRPRSVVPSRSICATTGRPHCGRPVSTPPADGVERRGSAGLPAAGGSGPALRRHHRAVRAGQSDRDRAHGYGVVCPRTGPTSSPSVPSASAPASTWPSCSTVENATPLQTICRARLAGEIRTTAAAYEANGFELPDDELATFGGDSGYLTATLT